MAQGRGNGAVVATTFVVLLVVILLQISPQIDASAGHHLNHVEHHAQPPNTYFVGEKMGWNFRADEWQCGKTFKAGDILVFSYTPVTHNVVEVCQASYDTCTVPPDAVIHTSGDDRITLKPGMNFFICGVPGHCTAGMKLAINAL